jgi:hypothetical protein
MSHDGETSGPVTRKERRVAYGKRQAAPRHVFSASEHIREDWTPGHLIEMLESRARGYNGILRAVLCTAAAMLRDAMKEDLLREQATARRRIIDEEVAQHDAKGDALLDEIEARAGA